MTKKIKSERSRIGVLFGCILLMLYSGSNGYEAGDACNTVEHAPHSSDCTKFYHCENDIFIEKECPSDLHFNPEILVCDYAANANCQLTLTTIRTTTETKPETTTLEIQTEPSTDETSTETTEWITITTEKDISVEPTQTSTTQFTETTQPLTSEMTTEALTEIPEQQTTEIGIKTSESFTETTEHRTSEFITDNTTAESSITEIITTTPQTTTTAEPFDEFGGCLEYTTGSENGYTDFMHISDIGKQRADYVELKVFVRTAKNMGIMLTADRSEAGLEIVNSNNEVFMIKQKNSTIKKVNRSNLLNVNEYIPFIIRIFEKRIEVQPVGERKLLLEANVETAINVTLISFRTSKNTIGKWLYGCQVNPTAPTWSLNGPANSCERVPSGVFLRLSDYHSSPNHENIELKVYVATSAETVIIHLSSTDYSPSGSPYYDIVLGKLHQIWRRNELIASKMGSMNLFHTTQLVPIFISITSAGRIQVTLNNESKHILNFNDTFAIDVQYVSFITVGDIPSVWYHGDC